MDPTELGLRVVSLEVGGGISRKTYTKISINSHIQKLLIAMRSVFFFSYFNMHLDTNNLQKPESSSCYQLEPDGCYFVIFEHSGESVFMHALKKVKSGRIASGQTFGNALSADSSDCASKPNHHSAKNYSVVCPCSFGKTMLLLGKHAN